MRLRVITKEKEFLDFDIEVPFYLKSLDKDEKYNILIVEEKTN